MSETKEILEQGKETGTHEQSSVEEVRLQGEETVEVMHPTKVMEEVVTVSESATESEVGKHSEASVEKEAPIVEKSINSEVHRCLHDQATTKAEKRIETRKDWSSVSPGKIGRSVEKQETQPVISPSRFQLLAEERDEDAQSTTQETEEKDCNLSTGNIMEDAEEGEILQHDGESKELKKDEKVSKPI
ncbi:Uncharacterized protein Rs2_28952 [Raphanus sativus]|nr:Uncharacterized protein Rs2_28952 [Raphanus sativus]